jgi:hypothetical protein
MAIFCKLQKLVRQEESFIHRDKSSEEKRKELFHFANVSYDLSIEF